MSKARFWRLDMTATPWSPIVPGGHAVARPRFLGRKFEAFGNGTLCQWSR